MPDSVPRFDVFAYIPNLAIVSIAGNVDHNACDVKVADLYLVKDRMEDYVLDLLSKRHPNLVGFSCMSFQYHNAIKLARLVKGYDENILVVLGGYHPTLMYDEIADSPDSQFIDFIVRGEGEISFNELVNAIEKDTGYDKIPGLSYKMNGIFHHNLPGDLLSLDTLQLPKRDARLITKGCQAFGLQSDAIETSRGCTYNCKFCSIKHMYGRSFRKYEISRVIEDIKNAHKHGARWLIITDDNITLDLKRLGVLCEEIVSAKLNSIHYLVQASVKGIAHSAKLVQKMADAGIKIVFLGIESLSKADLDFLGKKTTTPEDTRKAVKYLKDNEIVCFGGFIVGNPNDDEESLWNTFNIARELGIDTPAFPILIPHVKTEIREELMAEGLVTNVDDFSTYDGFSANIRTKYLMPEEIDSIVEKMYSAYYDNLDYLRMSQLRRTYPKYFWKAVAKTTPRAILNLISFRGFRKRRCNDFFQESMRSAK